MREKSQPHIAARQLAVSLAVCLSASVHGEEPDAAGGSNSWSAELRAGGEYDTNVSVDELDASSERSDYAALLEGQVEFQREFGNGAEFSAGYDVSQTFYDEFSELDRLTHILSTDLKGEWAGTDIGLSYHYVDSNLDGDDFLGMNRVSPYASTFLTRRLFARLAYVFSDKDIEERPDRDADTDAGEVDFYWFRRGLRSYFNLGYRYKDEDASADRFDYKSNSFKLRYVHRFPLLDRLAKVELAWRFEDRDYSSPTPSIGEDRSDDRHRLEAELEIPVMEDAAIVIYGKYNDYESNLPRADYDQTIVGTQFVYRW